MPVARSPAFSRTSALLAIGAAGSAIATGVGHTAYEYVWPTTFGLRYTYPLAGIPIYAALGFIVAAVAEVLARRIGVPTTNSFAVPVLYGAISAFIVFAISRFEKPLCLLLSDQKPWLCVLLVLALSVLASTVVRLLPLAVKT
jgi:hypothetical protein